MNRITLIGLASLSLVGMGASCALHTYQPLTQKDFRNVIEQRCGSSGERVQTTAHLNQVYESGVILWDGLDETSTYSVAFVQAGLGARAAGVVGTNRFESAYKTLRKLKDEGTPITLDLTCHGDDVPPVASGFSYRDENGSVVTFELE